MKQPKEPLSFRIAGYLGRVTASYTIFGSFVVAVHLIFARKAYAPHEVYSFEAWMTSLAFTAIVYVLVVPLFNQWKKQ